MASERVQRIIQVLARVGFLPARSQFAPLPRPSLWERIKRWWYSL